MSTPSPYSRRNPVREGFNIIVGQEELVARVEHDSGAVVVKVAKQLCEVVEVIGRVVSNDRAAVDEKNNVVGRVDRHKEADRLLIQNLIVTCHRGVGLILVCSVFENRERSVIRREPTRGSKDRVPRTRAIAALESVVTEHPTREV